MKNMLILPEDQAAQVLDMRECLNTVQDAFIRYNKGEIYPGGRIALPVSGGRNIGQWLTAVCTKQPFFGFKFSAVFPDNKQLGMPCDQSTISLFSNISGEQLALIGANYLTALKTGAAAGIATDLCAKKDACSLGIIGTGYQAYTQVLAMEQVRQLKELRLYNRSSERMEEFAQRIAEKQSYPYKIIPCKSANVCVEGSDIICTVTSSRTPVFDAEALKPGTHINAIGSFTPAMQELSEETVRKADFVVTEHENGLWAAAGDILIPYEKGVITRDKVRGSIADVLCGNIAGRQSDEEITLYESVGSCVLDIAIAIAVYEACK